MSRLTTDVYPPFRLDLDGNEPSTGGAPGNRPTIPTPVMRPLLHAVLLSACGRVAYHSV